MWRRRRRGAQAELAALRGRLVAELDERQQSGEITMEAWAIAKREATTIVDEYRYAELNGRARGADVVRRAETSARAVIDTWTFLRPVSRAGRWQS